MNQHDNTPPSRLRVGQSTDPEFLWAVRTFGDEISNWARLAALYMAHADRHQKAYGDRMKAVGLFIARYLVAHKMFDPRQLLSRHREESLPPMLGAPGEAPFRDSPNGVALANYCHDWLEWILDHDSRFGSEEEGHWTRLPGCRNPFSRKTKTNAPRLHESIRKPLPLQVLNELKAKLAPGDHFSDWKWAHEAFGGMGGSRSGDWFEVTDPAVRARACLNPGDPGFDPDLVCRRRRVRLLTESGANKSNWSSQLQKMVPAYREALEIWSPARAMLLLTKLELPLRTFQVRVLDSGEADMDRIDVIDGATPQLVWSSNADRRHQLISELKVGDRERVRAEQGVFRRFQGQLSREILTGFYINTNKTADASKDASHRGYFVAWQHTPLLRWLIKLRNWQERYNPIERPSLWTELERKHTGQHKSETELRLMSPTCFLFRDAAAANAPSREDEAYSEKDRYLPLPEAAGDALWGRLLQAYEKDLADRGVRDAAGEQIRLIKTVHASSVTTEHPLHSLRVSLLTALAFEGQIRPEILMKLAGHSRIVMTLHYMKQSATALHEELSRGRERMLAGQQASMAQWLKSHEVERLTSEVVMVDPESAGMALGAAPEDRNSAGWLRVADGWCLAGGNTSPNADHNRQVVGCFNGGRLLRTDAVNRYNRVYASVPPRKCAESGCRWLVTGPAYVDALVAKLNLKSYHLSEASRVRDGVAKEKQLAAAAKYDAEKIGAAFDTTQYNALCAREERADADMATLSTEFQNVLHLVMRCLDLLAASPNGQHLVAAGSIEDIQASLENVDSELLQIMGICSDAEIYPELRSEVGEVVYRRSQLLDALLTREYGQPLLFGLDKQTQLEVGNRIVDALATATAAQTTLAGEAASRFQILSLTATAIERTALPISLRQALDQVVRPRLALQRPHKEIASK